jgi:glycosyltransferase involved in cell wall biosynthesis
LNNKIFVVHSGVKSEKIEKYISYKRNSKNNFVKIAMYTGSLSKDKGLESIYHLAKYFRDTVFVLIGEPQSYSAVTLLKKIKFLKNVLIIPYVKHNKIKYFLQIADILIILPSKSGIYNNYTSPLKLFEYMNAKKPILSTNMPSILEILKDNYNSVIAEDRIDDIIEKFRYLICDQSLQTRISKNAKNCVQKYSWENRAHLIKNAFNIL